jgi:hypothetical protein
VGFVVARQAPGHHEPDVGSLERPAFRIGVNPLVPGVSRVCDDVGLYLAAASAGVRAERRRFTGGWPSGRQQPGRAPSRHPRRTGSRRRSGLVALRDRFRQPETARGGGFDGTESDRPWQVGVEDPPDHRPKRTATVARHLERERTRQPGPGTARAGAASARGPSAPVICSVGWGGWVDDPIPHAGCGGDDCGASLRRRRLMVIVTVLVNGSAGSSQTCSMRSLRAEEGGARARPAVRRIGSSSMPAVRAGCGIGRRAGAGQGADARDEFGKVEGPRSPEPWPSPAAGRRCRSGRPRPVAGRTGRRHHRVDRWCRLLPAIGTTAVAPSSAGLR